MLGLLLRIAASALCAIAIRAVAGRAADEVSRCNVCLGPIRFGEASFPAGNGWFAVCTRCHAREVG